MIGANTEDKFILFLQLTDKTPEAFFHATERFAKWNIRVVPITPEHLKGLPIIKRTNVLVITESLRAVEVFHHLRKNFLDFVLLRQKINLFHISSFSAIDIAHRLEKKSLYHHYILPVHLSEVCHHIATEIYIPDVGVQMWPGGKRAKLPGLS